MRYFPAFIKSEDAMLRSIAVVAIAAVAALSASPASAQYPEKNIEFLIPFGPGGGFDRTVRLISPYMEKALPNRVEVLPRNLPGAGGRRALATVYRAKPDGHLISIMNSPGAAIPMLLGEKVEYDLAKFAWIAKIGAEDYMVGVSAKSSIRTIDDLKKLGRPIKMPTTGFGSTAYAAGAVFAAAFGLKAEHISGYKGTNDYIVGIVRGDGDIAVAPVSTFRQFVESGAIRPLMTFEEKSSMPGIKTVAELGHPELSGLAVERFIVGPPKTPANIVKILSDAIGQAASNPELKAKAEKSGEPLDYIPAANAKAAFDKALAVYEKYKSAIARK
ncbi:MAG: tripartite tricarboxylate transporter substrate binding protein [Rhizobiales bacterium]|nr:tripartite tricarboxylate transporter substrate binding protein [Hyphomicrobiales bacterium]